MVKLAYFYVDNGVTKYATEFIRKVNEALTTLSGGIIGIQNFYAGPFEITNKYVIVTTTDQFQLHATKTTQATPGDGDWSTQDSANSPKYTEVIVSYWAFEFNSDIHIAVQLINGDVSYNVFDPGTDTWAIINQEVANAGDVNFGFAPANPAVSLAIKSNGVAIVIAAYNDGTNEKLRCFLRNFHSLWSWGDSAFGKLGDGQTSTDFSSPIQIGALLDWSSISAATNHSQALKSDGTIWAWGSNTFGSIGDNTTVDKSSPVQVGVSTDWTTVVAGDLHSLAVNSSGQLYAWGTPISGRLGNGTTTPDISSPIQIGALTDWSTLDADTHALAVKTDGTLWAWGTGTNGKLGDGTAVSKSSPVQIGTLTDWKQASTGASHSHAIKINGTLWAWGAAAAGRLGNGTSTPNISSPVQIGTLTDWLYVEAGETHSHAIKTDGTLWAWGAATSGVLGNGTASPNISSPIQIGSLTDWTINISADGEHTLAVKTDGTLWGWGTSTFGELGDGTTIVKSSPIQIGSLTDWSDVSAGNNHTHAVKKWTNIGEASGGIASTDYQGVSVVGPDSSNRISWAYKDNTNNDIDLRSLSSSDVIAAVTEIDSTTDTANIITAPGVIDSSNKIYMPYIDSDDQLSIASWTSGATPTVSVNTTLTVRTVFGHGRTSPDYAVACLADDSDNIHLVFSDNDTNNVYHEDDVDGAVGSDTLLQSINKKNFMVMG